MKKNEIDSLKGEYKSEELGKGIRGKYYQEYQKSNNLILLSPDVAKVFSNDDAVNTALRSLIALAKKSVKESSAIEKDSPIIEPAIDRIREKPVRKYGVSRKD